MDDCSDRRRQSIPELLLQLEREPGLGNGPTGRYLCQRIREVLQRPEGPGLKDIIKPDETYMESDGVPKCEKPKRGRGGQRTIPVLGLKERNGPVKAKAVSSVNTETINDFVAESVSPDVQAFHTDEFAGYKEIDALAPHSIADHSRGYVSGDVHTNNVEGFWSLLKR